MNFTIDTKKLYDYLNARLSIAKPVVDAEMNEYNEFMCKERNKIYEAETILFDFVRDQKGTFDSRVSHYQRKLPDGYFLLLNDASYTLTKEEKDCTVQQGLIVRDDADTAYRPRIEFGSPIPLNKDKEDIIVKSVQKLIAKISYFLKFDGTVTLLEDEHEIIYKLEHLVKEITNENP